MHSVHAVLSFLITLSAIAESQRERQVATGFEDLYFLDLQCFGLFVADAQCNRRKGIVVRLALRAIADDRVPNAGQLASR